MHYYQFHIGDYRAATAHLSNEEDLAYRRLLDMYYDSEQKIPLDTHWVSRRLRIKPSVILVVLEDFFTKTDDGWLHDKCDVVIEHYHKNALKNKENGKLGGRPKKTHSVPNGMPMETEVKPTQKATINQETSKPVNQEKDMPIAAKAARNILPKSDSGFERFWSAYNHRVGRHKAVQAWSRINPDENLAEVIISAAEVYAKATSSTGYQKHPTTWLNGKHWEDDPSAFLPKIARQVQPQLTHHQATKLAASRMIFGDERTIQNERIIDITPVSAAPAQLGAKDF